MRRTYPILSLLTFAAALVACYAAWGQSRSRACCQLAVSTPPSRPAECRRSAQAARSDNEKLVEGLVAILNETDSTDTMLVTVKALSDLGPRARLAVPAIIRGADRLGMLKDIAHQKKGEDAEGMAIVEAIEQILKGNAVRPAVCCQAGLPSVWAPASQAYPAPVQPVTPPVQPVMPPAPSGSPAVTR